MGMFDWLICEYPLPGKPFTTAPAHRFQTKSFDCTLSTFRITYDGRLVLHDDAGSHVALTGTVNFYDYEPGVWVRYAADFRDGYIQEARQVEFQVDPRVQVPEVHKVQSGTNGESEQ